MNDKLKHASHAPDALLDRAKVYSLLSALFSHPASDRFAAVDQDSAQQSLLQSCKRLDPNGGNGLYAAALEMCRVLRSGHACGFSEDHAATFGHTLSREVSPYELETLKHKEVFSLTQAMADIRGFYAAFGLEIGSEERADHIAVEMEFLSYLLLKESLAIENDLGDESILVCRNARKDFASEHFFAWAPVFAERLAGVRSRFYRSAAALLRHFVAIEATLR